MKLDIKCRDLYLNHKTKWLNDKYVWTYNEMVEYILSCAKCGEKMAYFESDKVKEENEKRLIDNGLTVGYTFYNNVNLITFGWTK